MITTPRTLSALLTLALCVAFVRADSPAAPKAPDAAAPNGPITTGLRVFTCGHSFHATVIPKLLGEIAVSADLKDHTQLGVSMIGASRAIQHWNVPDAKNQAKTALIDGKVDVLTLSCMEHPDEGIANFAKLAVEHNPNVRITLQELWIPEDHWPFDARHRIRKSRDEFDDTKIEDLKKTNEAYFKEMEDYVTALNKTVGKTCVFIVPDCQAATALREKILAGAAPGIKKQSDLFADPWGHPTPPLRLLSAYCHYSVIYRRSPVGLPIPPSAGIKDEALNHLLQELAWDAVSHHPLSGVKEN